MHAKNEKIHRLLLGKPEKKISLWRHRRRWENTIKMGIKEVGYKDMGWFHLAWNRVQWRTVVNTVTKVLVP
jgi:hypothetical protein